MNIGFVFLVLALQLGFLAISVAAYVAPPVSMGFRIRIVTVVVAGLASAGFGFLAGGALLLGALT